MAPPSRRAGDPRPAALGRRLRAHALDAPAPDLDGLAGALLGFQDAGPGTAAAGVAVRLADGAEQVRRLTASGALLTVMSLRGVPHLHRAAELPLLQSALRAGSTRDLEATCGPLATTVRERADPVGEVAAALEDVVRQSPDAPVTKADLSAAATDRLPPDLAPYCRPCGAPHPLDGLFRLATLRAGLALVAGARPQTFHAVGTVAAGGPPDAATARRALVAAATAVSEPVAPDQVAAWLGWHVSSVREYLPAGAATAADPAEPRWRLLPPRDPWLRGTDRRWLLGAHADRRGEVYRSLGAPGVVLRAGEVAGVWRQRSTGKGVLGCELDLWEPLSPPARGQLEADAAAVAATRGLRAEVVARRVAGG